MSTDIDQQKTSEGLYEHVYTRVTDSTAGPPSMKTQPAPQTVDKLETAQDNGEAPRATQTTTDETKAMIQTVVLVKPEPVANTIDVSPDATIVSKSNVLKLQTPAIAISPSDISLEDTMSTRSSSSSLPTEMTGPPSSVTTEMTGPPSSVPPEMKGSPSIVPPVMTEPPATDERIEGPSETEVSETSNRILDVILEYSLSKFDSTAELHNAGRPKFLAVISRFVRSKQKVVMCLPAFPFKSANKVEKVLGTLPDKAEELALGRLNTMCATIGQFYEPGAELTIISDGLVYNGLLYPLHSQQVRPARHITDTSHP